MIIVKVTGNPFSADETLLGLLRRQGAHAHLTLRSTNGYVPAIPPPLDDVTAMEQEQ